jgi:two-component system phosphate regulon sensor histidine kinase PhoR
MSPLQQREITNLFVICILSALLGLLFDLTFLFVAISLLIYIAFMLRNIFKLHDWLLERQNALPEARGYWGEIFNKLHIMEKQQKIRKKRLSTTLKRFQKAAEALPDGVIILSQYNKIEWLNPSARTLLGISLQKDIGQKINNLIRHPRFQSYLLQSNFSEGITIPSPTNPDTTLTMQIIPFGHKQKMIFSRDVTHITKLEEMRTNFVSNVSHEMRSPLTVLTGYLEMFSDNPPKDDKLLQKAIDNMYQQAMRMQRLVTDLLTLSKMETAPVEHTKSIDVATLLISLKENAEVLAQSRHHQITLDADKTLNLRGNLNELHSLFSNLINNAVRYTQDHGTISIKWYRKNNGGATFSVTDNGPGIAEHHIPHLTERFYRTDVDRSHESGGTGLGLAIVKYALERHDGTLTIKSELGKGSTFRCSFPPQRVVEN